MEFLPEQVVQFIDIAWGWIGSLLPFVVIAYVFSQFKNKTGSLTTSLEILSYSYWKNRDVSVIAKEFWSGLTSNNKILLVVLVIMNPLIGIVYGYHLFARYSTKTSKSFLDKKNIESPAHERDDEDSDLIQEEGYDSLSNKKKKTTHSQSEKPDPSLRTITPDVAEDDNPPLFS